MARTTRPRRPAPAAPAALGSTAPDRLLARRPAAFCLPASIVEPSLMAEKPRKGLGAAASVMVGQFQGVEAIFSCPGLEALNEGGSVQANCI